MLYQSDDSATSQPSAQGSQDKRKHNPDCDQDNPKRLKLDNNDSSSSSFNFTMRSNVMTKMINPTASHSSAQESHNKKTYNLNCDGEDDSKIERMDVDDDDERQKSQGTYHKGGLVHSLHGDIYQLKLQMLFLKRALDQDYEFSLGTEVEDAEKFDDIVFKYKRKDENGVNEIRFVQVKHQQKESIQITINDLLKCLQKYYISYRKIVRNPIFSTCKIKDFVIYNRIGFADLGSIKLSTIQENDDILEVTNSDENTECYKLIIPKEHVLYQKLRETSDFYILVKALKQHILEYKPLQLRTEIFKLYHTALSKHIFDILPTKKAKFRNDFLIGNNLSNDIGNFRNALKSAFNIKDNYKFQKELSQKEINVSAGFGQLLLEVQPDPTITDPIDLADKFAGLVIEARSKQENIITIVREAAVESYVDKLAYHVLVQDESQKELFTFKKMFLDDNNKNNLKGNLLEFRAALETALKKNNINFTELRQYKFKISEFYTCEETLEGELSYPKIALPNDKIEDAEIEEFLDKLVFAVNQSNEKQLGNIIKKKIGESFNLLEANLVSDSFKRIMLDWFKMKPSEKGKGGEWLNAASGQIFIKSIEQKVSSLISKGISVAYSEKLAKYDIRFRKNKVFENLKAFLSKENILTKIFHVIALDETILSALNVYSALNILEQHDESALCKENGSYIFMRLSTLLKHRTQLYVIDAFTSKDSHNLLIIDCKSDDLLHDLKRLHKKLFDILHKTNKKIILITKQPNILIDKFLEDLKSKVIDNTSFADLCDISKKNLLMKKVIFQGVRVSINKLIDKSEGQATEMITRGIMVKLLEGDEINISDKLKDLGEVHDYYIDRRFRRVIFSKEKIKKYLDEYRSESDLFVISGIDSGLKHNNVYSLNDAILARLKFNELCDQNRESNIHWLKSDFNKLIWYKSHGSITNLVLYRIREKNIKSDNTRPSSLLDEVKLVHEDDHQKVVIVSDTAGMGKSTVLTHLSQELKKTFSSLWVTRINLNDYTKVFQKILNNRKLQFSDQNIVEFLLNDMLALQEQPELEKKLFDNYFNKSGYIVFLFDELDEISPNYKNIVIDLLQSLKKSKVNKIIVTTRPNMSEELEQALGVFSYVLDPLSEKEQIDYLTKFWTKKFNDEKYTKEVETYAESTIAHIHRSMNYKDHEFIGTPLQTMMFAEVFQENAKGMSSSWQNCPEFLISDFYKPNLPKDFSLLDLYEHFAKRKFCQYYLEGKKGRDLTIVGEIISADIYKEQYKIFIKKYSTLALRTLFNNEELKVLLSQAEIQELKSQIEAIQNGEHNEGIVCQIIDDKPHFIHRTFAEYFASFSIARKMLTVPVDVLQCIDNVLLNTSPIFISSLINQLDGQQKIITSVLKKPLLQFVLTENHTNFIRSLLQISYSDWPKKLDASGKTFLHYFEHDLYDIVKNLLDYANDTYEEDVLECGSFKTPKLDSFKLVKFIDIQDKDGKTALHYALRQNFISFSFELLLRGANIDSLTDDDLNKLLFMKAKPSIMFNDNENEKIYRSIQEKIFLKSPGLFHTLNKKQQSITLSFFFNHGRVKVIKTLLGIVIDLKLRRKFLNNNNYDYGYTALDIVNDSVYINDDEKLEITKYIIENGGITTRTNNYITYILEVAAHHGHEKTFKYFIAHEKRNYYCLHLLRACENNCHNIIKYLFENCKDNNIMIDDSGNTALHIACHRGAHLETIKRLMQYVHINAANNKGETPLFLAIYAQSRLNVIEYLVTKGAYVNSEDLSGTTPLSYAVESDQEEIIKYLLKKEARISKSAPQLIRDKLAFYTNPIRYDLDFVDINGFPRLHTAIKSGNFEWVQFLVRHGADVNKIDIEGNAPMNLISVLNNEIVELLLQYGAIFDKKSTDNKTLYDLLSNSYSDNKICRLLKALSKLFSSQSLMEDLNKEFLESELREYRHDNPVIIIILKARNTEGKTLLHNAADTNDKNGVAILLFYLYSHNYRIIRERRIGKLDKIQVQVDDDDDYKEEINFPRHNHPFRILYQFYEGIPIDIIDFQGNTPLHLAAQKGHDQIVSMLLEEGAIFNSKNLLGETPEILAINNNNQKIIELLQPTKNIFIALENNNTLEVEKCIYKQAYINTKNQFGKTPLHLAAYFCNHIIAQLLLSNGAYIEAVDFIRNTSLHIAAEKDKIKTVQQLLKHGAIYNAKNTLDQRPLDLAHNQSRDLLKQIDTLFQDIQSDDPQAIINNLQNYISKKNEIDISTIINVRDNEGNTLLHYAANFREYNIVKFLLEKGAIFNAQNKFEETPIDFTDDKNITTLLNAIQNMFDDVRNINQEQRKVSIKIITNVRDKIGEGLLHHAVKSSKYEIVKFLVENGAHVNLTDIDYSEAKTRCTNNSIKIIKYLIDNGDINATNDKGETPLFMAIYARSVINVIDYLVTKGSDVNWEDVFGNTPLSRAIDNNQEEIITYLLTKEARVSGKAYQALHDATQKVLGMQ